MLTALRRFAALLLRRHYARFQEPGRAPEICRVDREDLALTRNYNNEWILVAAPHPVVEPLTWQPTDALNLATPVVRKGEWITCTAGHAVAQAARDLYAGDRRDPTQFHRWQQPSAALTCAKCGAPWSRYGEVHFHDGWRA